MIHVSHLPSMHSTFLRPVPPQTSMGMHPCREEMQMEDKPMGKVKFALIFSLWEPVVHLSGGDPIPGECFPAGSSSVVLLAQPQARSHGGPWGWHSAAWGPLLTV